MMFRKLLLATTMLALPLAGAATAQTVPVTGVYLGAGAGVDFQMDSDTEASGGLQNTLRARGVNRSGKAEFGTGGVGVLSLGWGFGNGVRAEIEGNFRRAEFDSYSGNAPLAPWGAGRGTASTYGVMANTFFDFHQLGWPVVPYIGAGIGYAWTNFDNARATSRVTGERLSIDDTDAQFAFQGMAGASLPISAVPGLALTAEYRFFGTLDNEVKATLTPASGAAPQRGKVELDNYHHSFLVGLRYAFNQPTPPAPVPVAPAAVPIIHGPSRTYLVFFDFDRADLTDRARQIVAEAAQNSTRVQTTRIEVSGHADRSGSPAYNQRLSQRRADAVAAELARLGVARSAITIQAFGESRPLVPTADGVREPQNRRVEIVLR
ncbi:OmpA family protein [Roseomonas sp. 18066]|uniref:OmpA family protein n=1 Tax=Roseomonas sp. 18066 TaxID=2681412 RepID=UPI00135B450E|nr:OmpA family protein [Roseomonas sp. 18066]